MLNLIPLLSTVLPIIASSLLIIVISINFYFRIRRKFPISVNCWFCNTWTKVHYDDRDSFDCPNCLQYNGFTKDGDYNKIIPEQHDELMNKSTRIKNNKTAASNGLCTLCNNNQRLKIFQLANFVPLNEENYDVEIEHFQEQLEKAYKLCRKCDQVLKKTVDKQNAWIFGNKIKNLYSNGVSSLERISSHVKKGTTLSLLTVLNGFCSILLVLSIVFIIMSSIKYFTKTVSKYVPTAYVSVFKAIMLLANTPKIIDASVLAPYLPQSIKIEPFVIVCCIGLCLQIVGGIWEKYSATIKLNRSLCWIILLLTSWIRFSRSYAVYILLIEALCCVYLLWTSFNKEDREKPQKNTGKMRKLVKNLEYTCTDYSDVSDFEDVSTSSKKTNSSQDSIHSSHLQNHVPVQSTAGNVLNVTYKDLNKSLNNLHLGFKSPNQSFFVTSVPLKRPKPVLSPPKLQTMNSWVAGGFWRNSDGVIMPIAQRTNLSRSSSESSGFGSQHNENFQFVPARNNFLGEFDKLSMNSEFCNNVKSPNANYLFSPICKPVNAFYPNLQQNNLLLDRSFGRSPAFSFSEPYQRKNLYQNWSDKINSQATQSFGDLSLHSNYN